MRGKYLLLKIFCQIYYLENSKVVIASIASCKNTILCIQPFFVL